MEYEKCYVYESSAPRPTKRRRIEPQGLQTSWKLRQQAYQKAWRPLCNAISKTIREVNAKTVSGITTFLDECRENNPRDQISAGFIADAPTTGSENSILRQIFEDDRSKSRRLFTAVSSSTAPNLKTALKFVIRKAASPETSADEDDDEDAYVGKKGPKLLNYDLQILADHVKERRIQQVVVAFQDTEAIDSRVLSELIELFGQWQDRIPFVLLFNVATSVDFVQQRLSTRATELIYGRLFDVVPIEAETELVFRSLTLSNPPLWTGPNLATAILEQGGDYTRSIDRFVDAVQYAFMTCFFANALSIYLDDSIAFKDIPADHFQALRNLPSFREFCKHLLDNNETTRLRDLLESDEALYGLVRTEIGAGRQVLVDMMAALNIVQDIQTCLPATQVTPRSKLYIQALSNKLGAATVLRALLLTIRKSTSSTVTSILTQVLARKISSTLRIRCEQIQKELSMLVGQQLDSAEPLRSEEDHQNSKLRTTVVAQKVELSKHKAAISKQDAAYTTLLRRFTDALEAYFAETLIDPQALVFHEIFIYDLKSPHREVFTPRPRHAIERALATPHDYLDCSCCGPTSADADGLEPTLAATQPATALLYQLYLESGPLINVFDLWQAFRVMIGGSNKTEEDNQENPIVLAQFQRALAQLHYLGFLKATKKRLDHVAKVSWRGL